MLHKGRRAMWTMQPMPTSAAQGKRRIAPPIEEQQSLLTFGQRVCDGLGQTIRKPLAVLEFFQTHIDELNLRKLRAPMPIRQPHMHKPPAIGIHKAFKRRRGG